MVSIRRSSPIRLVYRDRYSPFDRFMIVALGLVLVMYISTSESNCVPCDFYDKIMARPVTASEADGKTAQKRKTVKDELQPAPDEGIDPHMAEYMLQVTDGKETNVNTSSIISSYMKGNIKKRNKHHEYYNQLQQSFPNNWPDQSLIDPQYTPKHASTPLWKKNEHGIVHILVTRFNQMQTGLPYLGQARFELFKTFSVPSVKAQSTQDFLWMVFTDPNLDEALLTQMLDQLKDFPNAVLIGLNTVPKDFVMEDWIDKIDKMFLGDKEMIRDYINASKTRILLETRLDADDSLYKDMMRNIQLQTARTLGVQAKEHRWNPDSFKPKQYRVFCAEHHLEWGYFNPWEPKSKKGHLVDVYEPDFCVTAGLTYAYQVGTTYKDVPTKAHHKLAREIALCDNGQHRTNCVERIDAGQYKYILLRSRTPTSTAMRGVVPTQFVKENKRWENMQDEAWNKLIFRNFNVTPESIWQLRQAFELNLKAILQDAIQGQCSKGEFGCSEASKKTLNNLLEEAERYSS